MRLFSTAAVEGGSQGETARYRSGMTRKHNRNRFREHISSKKDQSSMITSRKSRSSATPQMDSRDCRAYSTYRERRIDDRGRIVSTFKMSDERTIRGRVQECSGASPPAAALEPNHSTALSIKAHSCLHIITPKWAATTCATLPEQQNQDDGFNLNYGTRRTSEAASTRLHRIVENHSTLARTSNDRGAHNRTDNFRDGDCNSRSVE